MTAPLLTMTGVTKRFGGVHALRGVDFDLRPGEIHALLGENGAGKSTLMGVLSGVHAPDEGTVAIDGAPVRFASPRDAQAAGIATIFQELDLAPGLDVTANLFLGRELTTGGFLSFAAMRREARERLAALEMAIDADTRVADLSIGQRQVVAIVKALSYADRVLIMDEPTAALTTGEVDRLFGIMRRLAASGVGIVYISHRLEEVPQIADRVTVMRDGRVVGTLPADAPQGELVRLLVGRPLDELYPPRAGRAGRHSCLAHDHVDVGSRESERAQSGDATLRAGLEGDRCAGNDERQGLPVDVGGRDVEVLGRERQGPGDGAGGAGPVLRGRLIGCAPR